MPHESLNGATYGGAIADLGPTKGPSKLVKKINFFSDQYAKFHQAKFLNNL